MADFFPFCKKKIFIYYLFLGYIGSYLLLGFLSSCRESSGGRGLLFTCGVQASRCGGFSCWGAQALVLASSCGGFCCWGAQALGARASVVMA